MAKEAKETKDKKSDGPIKVKAVALGFYDNLRRRPGAIFMIKSEKEFSKNWMVRMVAKAAPAVEVEEAEEPNVPAESVI